MSTINKVWHLANKMPKKPTRADRARWHAEHVEACGCRAPSPAEQELIDEYQAERGTQPTALA
jgi:hypothetical protein